MILEAFAKYLQAAEPSAPAQSILARWLWERLSVAPETLTDRILHSELQILQGKRPASPKQPPEGLSWGPNYIFTPTSPSGKRLLKSLNEYASSYEQQKWSRWVHGVKATDFNRLYNND